MDDQETPVSEDDDDHPYIWMDDSDHAVNADPRDIVISVRTNNPALYTNSNVRYWLKATLDDYIILHPTEATHWEPFNVNIQNCQVTDYHFADPVDSYLWDSGNGYILYNIYTPY